MNSAKLQPGSRAVVECRQALKLNPGLEPARNRLRALGAPEN